MNWVRKSISEPKKELWGKKKAVGQTKIKDTGEKRLLARVRSLRNLEFYK